MKEYFTFDDVCILPKYSDIASRKDVDTSQVIKGVTIPFPLISAPMDTITGSTMASTISNFGGIGLLHRFWSIEDNLKAYQEAISNTDNPELVGCSFGLNDRERVDTFYKNGCRIFCLDIAYSYTERAGKELYYISNKYPDIILISGSVVGKEATEYVCGKGAWLARIGISPGGLCSTSQKTGITMPQLSAIIDSAKADYHIIADGGVKTPADFCKCLAGGASLVMLGSMLSATLETPGDIIVKDGKSYKRVRGMASQSVNEELHGSMPDWKTSEGVDVEVPFKGSVIDILKDINGGLRSSMTYVGARTLQEYYSKTEFAKVSHSSVIQSRPHILDSRM